MAATAGLMAGTQIFRGAESDALYVIDLPGEAIQQSGILMSFAVIRPDC